MERWTGRVALVTGASAGIGAAIVKELVLKGMKVIGVARRVVKIEELSTELQGQGAPGKLFALACDVTKESDVLAAFEWIGTTLGGVDVLVNNAGVFREANLYDGSTDAWRQTLDLNILGLSICTREAIKSMRAKGVDDGHVIHINSICGHIVVDFEGVGMYTASKYAVTALTEALRKELVHLKSSIRITSISPGEVKTDIIEAAGLADKYSTYYETTPYLEVKDISDAVLYVLGTPPHVQIHELTIKPIGELA